MRKKIIIGNWKMFKSNKEAVEFITEVESKLNLNSDTVAGIAVPFTMLSDARKAAKKLVISAQNCYFEKEGAFTGEISIPMLKSINVDYVVIGHSERRDIFKETDEMINEKNKALLASGLTPILCCGESLETYEAGKTIEWVKNQIVKAFKGISEEDAKKVVIAYEPIWAIGTGKVATPEIAQNVCSEIRSIIKDIYNDNVSQAILIQYGGSVKPDNISDILNQDDIDGALVGGASLQVESFLGLLK
ncbi:triose-phosphate isomerase [Spiroplasma turonicum]|uniref:Triosephosphate isomerase n=1 Tax=Spiroplasma turonicum TaxID=216946 RepID=A0A0K1P7P4_9MOLU|nr:triose-phosphate isomerase [Spiroplasma turonicum]AKU80214.1 triosephosphate isomerase [Spiroplasma turonicum]ALX71214.1 triosephosphate isomerase [Spiroplasma turonicum]